MAVKSEPGPLRVLSCLAAGPVAYRVAWETQRELVAARQSDTIPDTLLLLEHPPTVTFGKAADPRFRLLTDTEYERRGIDLVPTDRGGDVTYHGPGQLVAYPILHLGEGRRDLHRYVRALEEVVMGASGDFGIRDAARASWHAGVWVGDGYLAALGVKMSRWVTHHGFALNVTEAVQEGFTTIVPCGVAGRHIVSLSGLSGRSITVKDAAESVVRHFISVFGYAGYSLETLLPKPRP